MEQTVKTSMGTTSRSASGWRHKEIIIPLLEGLLLLFASLVLNYFAGTYATIHAGDPVRDLILDIIPVFDLDGLFLYGIVALFALILSITIWKPKTSPFIVKTMGLFIIIRSFFIILTHIGPIIDVSPVSPTGIARWFTFTGDLFFSAHTGLPFLMALMFWNNRILRVVFLMFTFLLAVVVLMGHYHYSIDVFSAFFITYGILHIGQWLFVSDYSRFKKTVEVTL